MNVIQQNKLNMEATVQTLLTSHQTNWESLRVFASGLEDFGEFIGTQ